MVIRMSYIYHYKTLMHALKSQTTSLLIIIVVSYIEEEEGKTKKDFILLNVIDVILI